MSGQRRTVPWLRADGTFSFGKHEGDTVEDVVQDDPGYIRWVLDTVEDISDEDRGILESVLIYKRKGRR